MKSIVDINQEKQDVIFNKNTSPNKATRSIHTKCNIEVQKAFAFAGDLDKTYVMVANKGDRDKTYVMVGNTGNLDKTYVMVANTGDLDKTYVMVGNTGDLDKTYVMVANTEDLDKTYVMVANIAYLDKNWVMVANTGDLDKTYVIVCNTGDLAVKAIRDLASDRYSSQAPVTGRRARHKPALNKKVLQMAWRFYEASSDSRGKDGGAGKGNCKAIEIR
ncbi:hypothetical protein EGW08_009182 [Elysia chlorotica]|uniref:Uncharacterized protein n=1 Tax=Elysia chlorotica TaxID=188477 RepID=A0A3S1A5A4_ELYCH|nr:hypothetical protein EGW08_009182 [Elysia chlorotica]